MADHRTFRPTRRRLLQALAMTPLLACSACSAAPARGPGPWAAWQVMRASSVTPDGRMVDHNNADLRSTSEGQSYALFFALVDNDQALFNQILRWTEDNLAGGSLAQRLPAWLWGREATTHAWKVLDDNPASDSDVWIAYVLFEAARLWQRPELRQTAEAMLAAIQVREVANVPGLGLMLLPGPEHFVKEETWRFNPSYMPVPLLRRFAALDPTGPWATVLGNSVRLLRDTAPHGYAPDWTAWRNGGFIADPDKGPIGSYDAIRCYLWAGMTAPTDPSFRTVLDALHGPLTTLRQGRPIPEKVNTLTGEHSGGGNHGYQAALLPYLQAQGETEKAKAMATGLPTPEQLRTLPINYYSQVLALFAQGWFDGRYRFAADGQLTPAWVPKRR